MRSRTYRTIYICDSFGTVGNPEAVRRRHQHLAPGGALVFNVTLPYAEADRWRFWIPEESRSLPEPWPEESTRRRAADGDEIELRSRRLAFDPLEQMWTREIQATLWHEGEAVQREEHILHERSFFRNELVLMLRYRLLGGRGLRRIRRECAASDDLRLVITARK